MCQVKGDRPDWFALNERAGRFACKSGEVTEFLPPVPKTCLAVTWMKQCDYCGRKAEDESLSCHECGTPFFQEIASETPETAISPEKEGPVGFEADGITPRWTAGDAWKCLGMLVIFIVVEGLVFGALTIWLPRFRLWTLQGFGRFTMSTVEYGLFILTALYFSRVESLQTFLKTYGLNLRPSSYIWFALVVTLMLRAGSHMLISSGLSRGVTNTSVRGFIHGTGLERYFYLAPLLMAPFCEEIFMRGFLYRAFRGSYSVLASTALIVGITGFLHYDQYLRSWAAVISLSVLTVLQCFLRERANLWDCIICHFVFNLTSLLASLLSHR